MDVKSKSTRGGYRPGAGRKKGTKLPETLEREAVKKHFDQRVLKIVDPLINAQALLALGQTFLYKIEKEWIKTGTNKKTGEDNGYWRNKRPVQVESQIEIESYLEHMVDVANGDIDDHQDEGETYYYMTAKEPNNMAIDSLHNRVHGKPKESVEVSGTIQFTLKALAVNRDMIQAEDVIELPQENRGTSGQPQP